MGTLLVVDAETPPLPPLSALINFENGVGRLLFFFFFFRRVLAPDSDLTLILGCPMRSSNLVGVTNCCVLPPFASTWNTSGNRP